MEPESQTGLKSNTDKAFLIRVEPIPCLFDQKVVLDGIYVYQATLRK